MADLRIAIVASRFNPEISERLVAGAQEALRGHAAVTLIQVPGAFEIPLAAKQAAVSGRFDAIVAIGCVIRGETAHFEYISQAASNGIAQVGLETGIPVTFGVLTADTDEQAMARSVPGPDNKGYHAAEAAVEMVRVLRGLR
jgi:6,7-dimethyl-8-ribityllumazine synthase